jgi:hypothetical protein
MFAYVVPAINQKRNIFAIVYFTCSYIPTIYS